MMNALQLKVVLLYSRCLQSLLTGQVNGANGNDGFEFQYQQSYTEGLYTYPIASPTDTSELDVEDVNSEVEDSK